MHAHIHSITHTHTFRWLINCTNWDKRGDIFGSSLPQVIGKVIDQHRIVDCRLLISRGLMMHTTEAGRKQTLDSLFPPEFPQLLPKARDNVRQAVEDFGAYASDSESEGEMTAQDTAASDEDIRSTKKRPKRQPQEPKNLPIMVIPFHPFLGYRSHE